MLLNRNTTPITPDIYSNYMQPLQPDITHPHTVALVISPPWLRFTLFCIVLLMLCSVKTALSEPLILVHPNGLDGFAISAENLNRVSEAEIRIAYQSEEETPPQVTGAGLGAQATIAVQNDTPGSITIRLKSGKPMSGHVLLAMAQIQGRVTFLTAWLRDEKGDMLTPRVSIVNPSDDELSAMSEQSQKNSVDAAEHPVVSTTLVYAIPAALATVSLPTSSPEGAAVVKTAALDETPRILVSSARSSVLDSFRRYVGERTPAALAGLFERHDAMFRQEPSVLLSNGTAALRLTVRVGKPSEQAPQFFITRGACTGLNYNDDGAWELEIIPERGILAATVTVLTGSEMIEYPLAVAPPQELFYADKAGVGEAEYVAAANRLARGILLGSKGAAGGSTR